MTGTTHLWLNRSKESLPLDVEPPRGREILGQLLADADADADVFVQKLETGAAGRATCSCSARPGSSR